MKQFLTGLVAGLAIGYLTAPRSGKDTRKQLTDVAGEQTNGLKEQWNKMAGEVSHLVDTVKSQSGLFAAEANTYADQAQNKFDKLKGDAISVTNQAKDQYNDKAGDTADAVKAGVNKAKDALTL